MIYFTSDTHYFHANIIRYSKRPYKDVEDMNVQLIKNWNSVVQPNDTVYHLGDVGFADENKVYNVLSQLNGHKHLLFGNHDKVLKKSHKIKNLFESFSEYKEVYLKNKQLAVLCHYPIMSWNRKHHGTYMLHGHCHGSLTYPFEARIMDVGVDPQGYYPISEDEVIRRLDKMPFKEDRSYKDNV